MHHQLWVVNKALDFGGDKFKVFAFSISVVNMASKWSWELSASKNQKPTSIWLVAYHQGWALHYDSNAVINKLLFLVIQVSTPQDVEAQELVWQQLSWKILSQEKWFLVCFIHVCVTLCITPHIITSSCIGQDFESTPRIYSRLKWNNNIH